MFGKGAWLASMILRITLLQAKVKYFTNQMQAKCFVMSLIKWPVILKCLNIGLNFNVTLCLTDYVGTPSLFFAPRRTGACAILA